MTFSGLCHGKSPSNDHLGKYVMFLLPSIKQANPNIYTPLKTNMTLENPPFFNHIFIYGGFSSRSCWGGFPWSTLVGPGILLRCLIAAVVLGCPRKFVNGW